MRKFMIMLAVSVLAGCASTGVFQTASGDDAVVVRVVNQLEQKEEASAAGGWQMPGMGQQSKAGVLTVDGDQLEVGADNANLKVEPGKHVLKLFADDGGMLRFGKLKFDFVAGASYDILIAPASSGEQDYRASLVEQSSPDTVLKEVRF